LRKEIDEQLPQDLGPWLAALGDLRREVLSSMPAADLRKMLLHELAQRHVCSLDACPSRQLAQAVVLTSEITK
jgi:siroheme synthase (precorrin-2 oxidase/ferrochelatase)